MTEDPRYTLCLYTTTQGHWKRRDRYQATVESFQSQVLPHHEPHYVASIKQSPGDEGLALDMNYWLIEHGFTTSLAQGSFSHGHESHQIEYLWDMARLSPLVHTEYVFHAEDDWLLKAHDNQFISLYIDMAIKLLRDHPEIMQVRIPRFSDEPARINGLLAKHGINTRAERMDEYFWRSGDWSNNPYVARTRDIRAALTFVKNSNLPKHSEHGMSVAMKMIGWCELPFAFFDPSIIRCGHIGTPVGQEDDLSKPLFSQ